MRAEVSKHQVTTSSHLHVMLPVKLSLTVNWESSKDLILLNSASFFKNLTCFNTSIVLCKAELTCWHHTAIHALLSVKQSWLADIILLFMLCKAELCWHHTADLLASYCHLVSCSAHWHHTAISCSAFCQAELTCWHHTAIRALQSRALLTSYCWLAGIILSSCALLCLLAPYCYLVLCSLSSRADSLAPYCHLVFCSACSCWHHTAISCSASCQAELTHWHHTATSCALLCLLTSYCQISMFHSWTRCEEIQEDQLCWSNAQIYRDWMSKKKKRHRLSIKLIIAQSWKHIKMKYDEILNFTLQCDASINFCWLLSCLS